MKIGILGGTGAMGSALGATWADNGHDVWLVDVNEAAVETIREHGLRVETKTGESRVVLPQATATPSNAGVCDLVVVFVKCYHTESAVEFGRPLVGQSTAVLSLQNGWGNGPKIARLLDPSRLLLGVTYHSAALRGTGSVFHAEVGPTFLGSPSGSPSELATTLASSLAGPNFEVTAVDDVRVEIWKKLCLNICTLRVSSLLRLGAGQLIQHEGTRELMQALLAEGIAVANANGIAVGFDERWEAISRVLGGAGMSKSSMLQDVEAGRKTEIEVINGAIVAGGEDVGVPTPVNRAMVGLISALQESYA